MMDGNGLRVTLPPNQGAQPPASPLEPEVDEEQLRTLWCGGVNEQCDEEVLYELFQNAGPLEKVTIPKDRETKRQKNFAFIVFQHEESVKFAYELFNGTELFRQKIRLQNKTTGLGLDQGRGQHQRSYSASASAPTTPGGYGGANNMMGGGFRGNVMSPPSNYNRGQVYQVPYGYGGQMNDQSYNGRERDQGRGRDNRDQGRDRSYERRREDQRDFRGQEQRDYRDRSNDRQYRRY